MWDCVATTHPRVQCLTSRGLPRRVRCPCPACTCCGQTSLPSSRVRSVVRNRKAWRRHRSQPGGGPGHPAYGSNAEYSTRIPGLDGCHSHGGVRCYQRAPGCAGRKIDRRSQPSGTTELSPGNRRDRWNRLLRMSCRRISRRTVPARWYHAVGHSRRLGAARLPVGRGVRPPASGSPAGAPPTQTTIAHVPHEMTDVSLATEESADFHG